MRTLLCLLSLCLGNAQAQLEVQHLNFSISLPTQHRDYLPLIQHTLSQASHELAQEWHLPLEHTVHLIFHENLNSYQAASGQAYFIAASSFPLEATIHFQRIPILSERRLLVSSIRHELFHMAQPPNWQRWLAEGSAVMFSGEGIVAQSNQTLSRAELNQRLTTAQSLEELEWLMGVARAYAEAYHQME